MDTILDFDHPEWMQQANCRTTDPETFFPEPGYSHLPAGQICGRCDVRVECREYAIANGEFGIWGGTNEHQRDALVRAREEEAGLDMVQVA